MNKGDQAKAVILVLAIVGVLGFAFKGVLFKGNPQAAPVAAAAEPAPETVVASNGMQEPEVTVLDLKARPGAEPTVPNPFRKTVAEASTGGAQSTPSWTNERIGGQKPGGSIIAQPGLAPFPAQVPDNMEFRLDGVLVGGTAMAIVTRAGETEYLEVGAKAAYGYTITAIRPSGIRVTQKSKSRWIQVGERLDPPGGRAAS